MYSRKYFTQKILNQLPEDQQLSSEEALKSWWVNVRDQGGFRLSDQGFNVLISLNLEHWDFDTISITARHLIELDKKLSYPYYLETGKKPKLILFGGGEATLLAIYGDLNKFLKGLENR
jgi:hypothetical protein